MSGCDGPCGCAPHPQATHASEAGGRWVSLFHVPKMDCPAEERLIRMALDGHVSAGGLAFDLPARQLRVTHDGAIEPIAERLGNLGLGATLLETRAAAVGAPSGRANEAGEAGTLKLLLAINAFMFVAEMLAGLIAQSAGLIGDSLDMFADAAVYGVALYAVGRGARLQMNAARLAGLLQLLLAVGLLVEVGRRFVFGSEPQSLSMMVVAGFALLANVLCLLLIHRHREGGVHMRASWIFSANDVLINAGVIVAGALVAWSGSRYPDLLIGSLLGILVALGARRILALRA
ncbi:cation transporter [Pseudomonas stutzeri]|nr:cation transporter [Stutzerimonas degradans]